MSSISTHHTVTFESTMDPVGFIDYNVAEKFPSPSVVTGIIA